jgi:hypothetical protein
MSSWLIHRNEEYFPEPAKFDPDRWVNAADPQRLHKAFVPFGKGSRACVGMKYVMIAPWRIDEFAMDHSLTDGLPVLHTMRFMSQSPRYSVITLT